MFKPITMYQVVCDRCGKLFEGTDTCESIFSGKNFNIGDYSDWEEIDGKHYCDACYEVEIVDDLHYSVKPKDQSMGRVIKFKAKRLDNGEWEEGSLLLSERGKVCIGTMLDSNEENGTPVCFKCREVDPSTICQFTGLKDENGNSIWEHDILKNHPMTNEVIFRNGSFMIVEDYGDDIVEVPLSNMILEDGVCYLKVIGNKFDKEK